MDQRAAAAHHGRVLVDDLGTPFEGDPSAVRRVVSLVPSLTESLALTVPGRLVGATDWCSHPAGLDVVRVGGTKSPRLEDVSALEPDLVLANDEENREQDVDALRAAGLRVWVTAPRNLAQAFGSLRRMLAACGSPEPEWLDVARREWSNTFDAAPMWAVAVVPVWRRPWRVLGRGTFAGDVLRHLGVGNVFGRAPERYPAVDVADMVGSGADLVVLPDEPYRFHAGDGPEAFPDVASVVVSGRHLTWYGPSLVEARQVLEAQLAEVRPAQW